MPLNPRVPPREQRGPDLAFRLRFFLRAGRLAGRFSIPTAAGSDAIVRTPDGNPFTTLFNRLSIDGNPMLRGTAA